MQEATRRPGDYSPGREAASLFVTVVLSIALVTASLIARLSVRRSFHDAAHISEHPCLLETLHVRFVREPIEPEAASVRGLDRGEKRADSNCCGEN